MKKLTDKSVRSAKVITGESMISDGNGLYLRVRSGNAPKVWVFRFTLKGKTKKIQLGTYPLLSLASAREEAIQLTSLTKQGIDPVEERKREAQQKEDQAAAKAKAIAAQASRLTIRDLFERWASVDLTRRKDGGAEVRRMFEKDVLPKLGSMAVEDVRKGHITGVVDTLLARGVTRMAKLIFALMRQMFRFAVDRDIIEFEPSASIRKAKIGGKDTERERVLTEEEIKVLVKQIGDAGLLDSTEAAIWIALSTCCRIGELLAARWEHVDFEKRTWWIPPSASKNGKEHTVYFSDFTLRQFLMLNFAASEQLIKRKKTDHTAKLIPWIYPNRHSNGGVCSKTVTKQLGDRQRPGLKPMKGRAKAEKSSALALIGGRWGPHDLRRTGATMMVMLGVLPEVAERCLNHTEQNRVKRIYQRHSYENEMREAWHILGKRLDQLTDFASNPSGS